MIRPVRFGFNAQTAQSNSFQQNIDKENVEAIQSKALEEFYAFSDMLILNGIDVIFYEDTVLPHTPDSIFPNNWISFHENNELVLYPMLAENRRLERREDIINISPRTDILLFEQLCKQLNFESVSFKAIDKNGADIYHTNVLMCVGKGFSVLCEDCIPDKNEFKKVVDSLKKSSLDIISISFEQMNSFAGNMYQLQNFKGEPFIVMSEQAFRSLKKEQIIQLQQYGKLLHSPLNTIEKYGGGSARCMIAEIR
ncbi:MAG: arginine deiminase-related protein [Bacteroidetes bacterium]|nr:arginine deiminase-related protein [Bacteroidota bacterium]